MEYIENQIRYLRSKLVRWERLYYLDSISEVSDYKYDRTINELRKLESQRPDLITIDSPTQRVGGCISSGFVQVSHMLPMLSLDHVFKRSELINFDKRISRKLSDRLNYKGMVYYCCELKIDGVAVNLLYKNGVLVRASTRGNGILGEDITSNIRTIRSVPLSLKKDNDLPSLFEVRGEIFISKLNFLRLNEHIKSKGGRMFANPRSCASGSLRHLDSSITAGRHLSFLCYGVGKVVGGNLPNSQFFLLDKLKCWGLPIHYCKQLCFGVDEVLNFYDKIIEMRSILQFNIDGIVIKLDDLHFQNYLGCSLRAPCWAIAYKFLSEEQITEVCDVVFQVGRTGVLTPVAQLTPVIFSDVVISRASLYNFAEIDNLGLMIGDRVVVRRSGDVIPKIIKVLSLSRCFTDKCKIIEKPIFCPSCGSKIKILSGKSNLLYCTAGSNCIAQLKGNIKHFVSRKAMNIYGMGIRTIALLVDHGLIKNFADIFRLNESELLNLNGMGKKSIRKLLSAIVESKRTTFVRFLYSLGIRSVGESIAYRLAASYGTIDKLIQADLESLMNIPDIGCLMASYIKDFFDDESNVVVINELLSPKIGIYFAH